MKRMFQCLALLSLFLCRPASAETPKQHSAKKAPVRAVEKAKPENRLADAVMKKLAATPEYIRLEALYVSAKEGGPRMELETQAIFNVQKGLQDTALSAGVEKNAEGRSAVVFTQNGMKTELGSLVTPNSETEYSDAAAIISRFIVEYVVGDPAYLAFESRLLVLEAKELLAAHQDEGAKAAGEKALEVAGSTGPGSYDVGEILNELGFVYLLAGDHDAEAEVFYRRALAFREEALARNPSDKGRNQDVASALATLARSYMFKPGNTKAPPLYERAISLYEQNPMDDGFDELRVLMTMGDLANQYRDQHQYVEAEAVYRREVTFAERKYGPDHYTVSPALERLAEAHLDDVRSLYERSLANGERALAADPSNPELRKQVVSTLKLLAKHLRATDRIDDAQSYEKRAAQITKGEFVPRKNFAPSSGTLSQEAPPPPKVEEPSSLAGHIWVGGHWFKSNGQWEWTKGRLARERPGSVWLDGHWEMNGGTFRFMDGRWEPIQK
jgi:tetratricopeptide (TPR) repeat protein